MSLKKSTLYWYFKRKRRKANIRLGSHSQYGQDLKVYNLLGKPNHGVFVDIGANDGISGSNSLYFEEIGWSGICVEPNPSIHKQLQEHRKCQCINACITDEDGETDFLAIEGPAHMLSGIEAFMDERHLQRIDRELKEKGGSKQSIRIEMISPKTLMNRCSIGKIDFLSVDTEGCELPILQTFHRAQAVINVVSVENGSRSPELFRHMNASGYQLECCVGCDEIYRKI